ncbi:MAG: RecX family transcriptional regulator [Bacilli bacterium]|nr:RecX family transcriptional regulator [Bacilli bacterium]
MKIIKYKKGTKGKYKIFLDNDNTIVLYEDVILKYNLLLTKEIDEKLLIEIDKYNQECDVYYIALTSINNRFKSTYELRQFLIKKEYPEDLIDKAIDKLLKQGYLNDRMYARSYINNQLITTNKGPYKIRKELSEKKIDSDIIEDEIELYTDEKQTNKIKKLIEKGIKTNHNRGGVVLKQKIYNDLKLNGYDINLINSIINDYSFENNQDIAKKEYDKLYRKYSRKYSGSELEKVIKEKLYQRGLKYEEDERE